MQHRCRYGRKSSQGHFPTGKSFSKHANRCRSCSCALLPYQEFHRFTSRQHYCIRAPSLITPTANLCGTPGHIIKSGCDACPATLLSLLSTRMIDSTHAALPFHFCVNALLITSYHSPTLAMSYDAATHCIPRAKLVIPVQGQQKTMEAGDACAFGLSATCALDVRYTALRHWKLRLDGPLAQSSQTVHPSIADTRADSVRV